MKKIIGIILLITVLCFSACAEKQYVQEIKGKSVLSTEVANEQSFETEKDSGGGFLTTRKYRVRYYTVPYQFILIVGENAYEEWDNEHNTENPDDTNEMVIKKFVQYFDISREDFDKANLEFAKVLAEGVISFPTMNPKDYADQEVDEIYNADIVYTFDDEIINEYYLSNEYTFGMWIEYNDALEAGTYETRTTDWVDIEQMEAEIIAKYGEAEIVTTVSAEETSTEEIAVEESTEAVTDIPETASANETSNIAE